MGFSCHRMLVTGEHLHRAPPAGAPLDSRRCGLHDDLLLEVYQQRRACDKITHPGSTSRGSTNLSHPLPQRKETESHPCHQEGRKLLASCAHVEERELSC
jgi:hypothetical protein